MLTDVTEKRAAMNRFKEMNNVMGDQVKSLKLMHERKKDENDNLINALREMQSETLDKLRIGKLYYVVMLSRW